MRVRRLMLTAVLGAIGVLGGSLFAAGPAVAAVPSPSTSLIVNPSEGRADTQITVVYEVRGTSATICPSRVDFTWDGRLWGTVARPSNGCVFEFTGRPPAGRANPGQHLISAKLLHSTFTIIGRSATPTPSPTLLTPTPYRTTAGPAVPTDDMTGPPAGGVDTSQAAVAPLESGGSVLGEAVQQSGGGGATAWILIFGGILVLGGIAIFGLLIYWGRRGGSDDGGMSSDTEVFGA